MTITRQSAALQYAEMAKQALKDNLIALSADYLKLSIGLSEDTLEYHEYRGLCASLGLKTLKIEFSAKPLIFVINAPVSQHRFIRANVMTMLDRDPLLVDEIAVSRNLEDISRYLNGGKPSTRYKYFEVKTKTKSDVLNSEDTAL